MVSTKKTPQPAAASRSRATQAPASASALTQAELARRVADLQVRPPVAPARLLEAVNRITPAPAAETMASEPEDVRESTPALKPEAKRFHGAKVPVRWIPPKLVSSPCSDRFGYLSSKKTRATTSLPFDAQHQALLEALGDLMGQPGRDVGADSIIPSGFTYLGQFVDHDITLDVTSSLDTATDANTVPNMRTPALDLDSVYGKGPALEPYLYQFPTSGPSTAIKLLLGSNQDAGPGGPAGSAGNPGAMVVQVDFDVPRMVNPLVPFSSTNTAVIGDARNDENLIVSQLHAAMLHFHNQVVDLLVLSGFAGDIFAEAKRIVTRHHQWAIVHDFLPRLCGAGAVQAAMASVSAPIGSGFRMPVEFAVAAYRLGHSMIRDQYWVNFNFPGASLGQVFEFIRNPELPVLSAWVVDFNAFFDTGVNVPIHNKARKIDSVLAEGLASLPGFTGLMAVLAKRNLRRGLALGLPSGQGMAKAFGITPLSSADITQGLPADEIAVLGSQGGVLLQKTPLWYYVLREAMVVNGGDQLGPVGARIVAETFVRMLKRDADSYLNTTVPFTPTLPSMTPGDFTFADLVIFAGVTQP
jgi:hypothetical protein